MHDIHEPRMHELGSNTGSPAKTGRDVIAATRFLIVLVSLFVLQDRGWVQTIMSIQKY